MSHSRQDCTIGFHGYDDLDWVGSGLLHDCFVLSAAEEVLGHRLCWRSLVKMFLTLAGGVALWAAYGFLKSDIVIIIANVVSFILLMGILYFKPRESKASG
jgi:hypothetical protein